MDVIQVSGFCSGHGKCYRLAPDLLRPTDDDGHSVYIGGPIDRADTETVARGNSAIDGCPEQALSWQQI